jgi:predicted nicotinamide N-methyase
MPKMERLPEPYIQQAYGVYLLQSQHRLVRSLKRLYEPSVHGHKAWQSSFILMDYLLHRPFRRGSRVMEIGCGWGPAAVFCAKKMNARVTGVDVDKDVFPFLDVLGAINDVKVKTLQSRFEDLTTRRLGEERVIIGSDICFWDSLVKPLYHLVQRASKGGVERVIIADPGRPTFYELGELCRERYDVELQEWYAVEPNYVTGEVLEVRARASGTKSI